MAFKKATEYNEERFKNLFVLRNDGDFADVIFLYESMDDVLVADVHYIKSDGYNGYAHCCGVGCPACSRKIRVQNKLFIPLFNFSAAANGKGGEIQFWDRTVRFEPQLQQDVFAHFANPSEYVFRITRHGAAGSVDTTYEVAAVGKNTYKSYQQILADNHVTCPAFYSSICKEVSSSEMAGWFQSSSVGGEYGNYGGAMPDYSVVPRGSATGGPAPVPPAAPPAAPVAPVVDVPEEPPFDAGSAEDLDDDGDVAF